MWVWTQLFLHLQTSRWHPPSQEHGGHLSTFPLWKTTNILALLSNWCHHQVETYAPKPKIKIDFDIGYNFQLEFSVVASTTIKPEHPTAVETSYDGNVKKQSHCCQSLVLHLQSYLSWHASKHINFEKATSSQTGRAKQLARFGLQLFSKLFFCWACATIPDTLSLRLPNHVGPFSFDAISVWPTWQAVSMQNQLV